LPPAEGRGRGGGEGVPFVFPHAVRPTHCLSLAHAWQENECKKKMNMIFSPLERDGGVGVLYSSRVSSYEGSHNYFFVLLMKEALRSVLPSSQKERLCSVPEFPF
jgi:hypothetical protein